MSSDRSINQKPPSHLNRPTTIVVNSLILIATVGNFYKTIGSLVSWGIICILLPNLKAIGLRPGALKSCLALFAALSAGAALSAHPLASLQGSITIGLGMLFFIPGFYLGSLLANRRLHIFTIAPVSLLVFAHFAFPQAAGNINYFGFFGNPNNVGQGLAFTIMILLVVFCNEDISTLIKSLSANKLEANAYLKRIILVISTIAGAFVLLIICNSRASWLGLFAMALTFFLSARSVSLKYKMIMAVSLSILLFSILLVFDSKGFGAGSSIKERIDMASFSIRAWHNHFPIFGAGYGLFQEISYSQKFGTTTWQHVTPHNVYIDFLFSGGIWGAASVATFASYQARIFKQHCAENAINSVSLMSFSCIIGVLAIGMLDFSANSTRFIGMLATLSGIIYSQRSRDAQSI